MSLTAQHSNKKTKTKKSEAVKVKLPNINLDK